MINRFDLITLIDNNSYTNLKRNKKINYNFKMSSKNK